jgi:2-C-methyl-D-erythritol 4-phosphate cytidylyltransferase
MINQNAVILLAGGSGSRMGSDQAKQFIRVAGKPVLVHSFDALRRHLPKAFIVVVAPVEALAHVRELIGNDPMAQVVAGGSSRQASTLQGLKALAERQPQNVIIHDAARPFISGQIIHDVVDALVKSEAVDVAIPTTDTIIVERDGYIQTIPPRLHIMRGQTPQAFRYASLVRSYADLGEEQLDKYTDDCGIYLACHPFGQVRIVKGHEENIKITTPVDLVLADELFRIRMPANDSESQGIAVRGKKALIFGGSSGIGKALTQLLEDAGAQVCVRSRTSGCDIANESDVRKALEEANAMMGGIDYIINSAGVLDTGLIAEQTGADMAQQIGVNLTGAAYIAKWGFEPLAKSKGMLLQFSSSSYTRGRAKSVIYAATKAAIVNMTQGLSEEWAEADIRVNCIVPGRTDTEMRRVNFGNETQASLTNPYEVALAAAKLLNKLTTGQIIRV